MSPSLICCSKSLLSRRPPPPLSGPRLPLPSSDGTRHGRSVNAIDSSATSGDMQRAAAIVGGHGLSSEGAEEPLPQGLGPAEHPSPPCNGSSVERLISPCGASGVSRTAHRSHLHGPLLSPGAAVPPPLRWSNHPEPDGRGQVSASVAAPALPAPSPPGGSTGAKSELPPSSRLPPSSPYQAGPPSSNPDPPEPPAEPQLWGQRRGASSSGQQAAAPPPRRELESFRVLKQEDLDKCRELAGLAEAKRAAARGGGGAGGGNEGVARGASCTVRNFHCKEFFGDREVRSATLQMSVTLA